MKDLNIDNRTGKNNSGKRSNHPLRRLTVSSITGDNVFNPEGEALGQIGDLMIDLTNGRIDYVIIQFGGFLSMNQKYFAVPFDALPIDTERHHAFVLNESRESLKRYPGFDKDHWPRTNLPLKSARLSGSGFMGANTGTEY